MTPGSPPVRLARHRRLALVASLAALALCATAPAAERAAAKPDPEFFGVVPVAPPDGREFATMAESGVRTLRVLLFWPTVQPYSLLDANWGAFDYYVAGAARYGIRVFPTIYGTPGWAHRLGGTEPCGASCAPRTDLSRRMFASFARSAVERYGPGGSFWSDPSMCGCPTPVPVHAWQIWNEQNSPKYYGPRPNPADYARLLFETTSQIRAADPAAEVVLGGMWGPPKTSAVIPTADYLRRLYAIAHVKTAFDAVAVHPYAASLAGVLDQAQRVRRTISAAGDAGAGMWITELGWASGGPRNQGLVKTPRGQARLLDKSFRALIERRRKWRIRGITWYAWRDSAAAQSDCAWCARAGLRTRSGAPKPAARAYRRVALGRR